MAKPDGGGVPPSPWSYMSLGFELITPILLGVFGGLWLDGRWGTRPWLMVSGSLLGLIVGFYAFLKRVLPLGGRKG